MKHTPEEEIARLNAELERLKQDRDRDVANLMQVAKAAIAAKNGFLTNMSHELRTPLTAIIGFSELLSDQHFGKLRRLEPRQLRGRFLGRPEPRGWRRGVLPE